MIDLVESTFYDEDWPGFSSKEKIAYRALSDYFKPNSNDIRNSYTSDSDARDMASTWYADLGSDDLMDRIGATVAKKGCDEVCFTNVKLQLVDEFRMVIHLYEFKHVMETWANRVSYHTKFELANIGDHVLGMKSDDETPIPPPGNGNEKKWLNVMIHVATGLSYVASPEPTLAFFFNCVAAAGHFAEATIDDPNSPSAKDVDFSENNELDLTIADLTRKAENTYRDIKQMYTNQVEIIAGNFGKLKNFDTRVYYGTEEFPTEDTMTDFVDDQVNYFAYHAYAMLFPSKYNLCLETQKWYDTDHQHEPQCKAKIMEDFLLVTTNERDDCCVGTHTYWEERGSFKYPREVVDRISCDSTNFAWYCLKGNPTHTVNSDALNQYNTYLKVYGPSPDSELDEITACADEPSPDSICTVNGIEIGIEYHSCNYEKAEGGSQFFGFEVEAPDDVTKCG